jgi:hypothetical protein
METILIQITDHKAIGILHELEELHLIKVVKQDIAESKIKLSDKYKGVFSKDDADSFNAHTQIMRGEWNNI